MGEKVTVEVEMLAFMNGEIREVEIPALEFLAAPDERAVLELVYKYGQNDFQPKPFTSVSAGDVIRFRGRRVKVSFVGFEEVA